MGKTTALSLSEFEAAAEEVEVSCDGTFTTRYSPGLTMTTKNTNAKAYYDYPVCESSDPAITSAVLKFHFQGDFNCVMESSDTEVKRGEIRWNTGERSTIETRVNFTERRAGEFVIVLRSEVLEGKFAGSFVEIVGLAYHTVPEECFSEEGVEENSGPTELTITSA